MLDSLNNNSNRVIATVGTTIALLLAVNLGILLKSQFLQPPYSLATLTTYMFSFLGAIGYITYFTIKQLDNPAEEYIEGLVLGVCGSTAILVYLPHILFEPVGFRITDVMLFFVIIYLLAIGATAILVSIVIKGAELYASENGDGGPTEESITLTSVSKTGRVSVFGESTYIDEEEMKDSIEDTEESAELDETDADESAEPKQTDNSVDNGF